MIAAKIIKDSVNAATGDRLTTFLLKYPRFIHSELMTHRVFSRNAASSRAIPVEKIMAEVVANPAMPVYWGANQKGMQADIELPPEAVAKAQEIWKDIGAALTQQAARLAHIEVNGTVYSLHKQISNRVMESHMHMLTLVTATEYRNFFALRAHKDAQPEFQCLAYKMLGLYLHSEPQQVAPMAWHIPFDDFMPEGISTKEQLQISTARSARTSYKTIEGKIDQAKDIEMFNRLLGPGHWSPFEHCGKAQPPEFRGSSGNFTGGWYQYRKQFPEENRTETDLKSLWDNRRDFAWDDNKNNEWN